MLAPGELAPGLRSPEVGPGEFQRRLKVLVLLVLDAAEAPY